MVASKLGPWVLLGLVLGACQQAPAAEVRDYALEATALVQGLTATSCRNDRDCAVGHASGACVLGTCFGLLTSDQRSARRVLADRLAHADPQVRVAAEKLLLGAISPPPVSLRERLGAIEGLGALLEVDAAKPFVCGKVCMALRSETAASDERVAAAARRVLGRGGDPTVVADLIADLELGTQLLRAEAATALTPFVGRGDDSAVVQALIARLHDPSAVVQEAALRTLLPRAADPQVRRALAGLQQHGSGLSYAVDQALAGTVTPTVR